MHPPTPIHRDHSASLKPHVYQRLQGASPSLHKQVIEDLQESGEVITHVGSAWDVPPELEWNATFYMESVILFPDASMLTRLKYWAITNPNILNMCHLLDLTITHNMCFVMAMRIGDLKSLSLP